MVTCDKITGEKMSLKGEQTAVARGEGMTGGLECPFFQGLESFRLREVLHMNLAMQQA